MFIVFYQSCVSQHWWKHPKKSIMFLGPTKICWVLASCVFYIFDFMLTFLWKSITFRKFVVLDVFWKFVVSVVCLCIIYSLCVTCIMYLFHMFCLFKCFQFVVGKYFWRMYVKGQMKNETRPSFWFIIWVSFWLLK